MPMDEQELINRRIVELKHAQFGTWEAIAQQVNLEFESSLSDNAVRKRYYRQNIDDILDEMETVDLNLNTGKKPTVVNSIENDVKMITGSESVDQLLVDAELSLNDWDVTNYNSWEAQTKNGIETLRSIRLKRRVDSFAAEKLQSIVDELKDHSPKVNARGYEFNNENCLFVPCLFDVHVGKPSRDYIPEIYTSALQELISKAYRCTYDIGQILFPIGNDMLQFDGLDRKTTAGTLVDSDLSMYDTIDEACWLIVDAVEQLQKAAPVHVAVIGGNHDRLASYWLGKVVEAYFQNNDNVSVDASSSPRKYFQWGNILLGMTHGNEEKSTDLAALMAIEAPSLWGASTYREWLTGHLHKRASMYHMINESHGVATRIIPSLCDSDSWHILKGYVGNHRVAEGYVYSSRGFEDQLGVNIGLE